MMGEWFRGLWVFPLFCHFQVVVFMSWGSTKLSTAINSCLLNAINPVAERMETFWRGRWPLKVNMMEFVWLVVCVSQHHWFMAVRKVNYSWTGFPIRSLKAINDNASFLLCTRVWTLMLSKSKGGSLVFEGRDLGALEGGGWSSYPLPDPQTVFT